MSLKQLAAKGPRPVRKISVAPEKIEKRGCGVIVGRFQLPNLHEAHVELIRNVTMRHSKVIVFLGVSRVLGSKRNPLDFIARKQMIEKKFPGVHVVALPDQRDDARWSAYLDERVREICPQGSVTLYGGRDSFMSHYRGNIKDLVELEQKVYVSATQIRNEVADTIKADPNFRAGVIWANANRFDHVYPTVDIAIVRAYFAKPDANPVIEVLLARKPAEDQYRFVGGFADPKDNSYEMAAKREAREETGLELGDPVYLTSGKIDDWRYQAESDKIISLFFAAEYVFGQPQPQDDISELRWFVLKDVNLEKDIVPEHHYFMKTLQARVPSMKLQGQLPTSSMT